MIIRTYSVLILWVEEVMVVGEHIAIKSIAQLVKLRVM